MENSTLLRNVGVYLRAHTALQPRRTSSNEEIYSVVFLFYALKTGRYTGSYPNTLHKNQVYHNKSFLLLLLEILPIRQPGLFEFRINLWKQIFCRTPRMWGPSIKTSLPIQGSTSRIPMPQVGVEPTNPFFELSKTVQALGRTALWCSAVLFYCRLNFLLIILLLDN
jgi:hypothetical protein